MKNLARFARLFLLAGVVAGIWFSACGKTDSTSPGDGGDAVADAGSSDGQADGGDGSSSDQSD